jgi:oligopeptide transport system ATP-binding protein
MIAMALLCEPQLLIADEPTTALDVTVQSDIMVLLRDIQRTQKMSIVLITHDLALAGGLCERVMVMRHGAVVETGTVEAIFKQPQHPYTQQLLAATRH